MGLFDYVYVSDPRFVCSRGHDLSGEEFQSKDFGEMMGSVSIAGGEFTTRDGYCGKPEPDSNVVEIYCTCTKCPAFVQFGTGNLSPCDVTFDVTLSGSTVALVTRTSPSTDDFVRDEPLQRHMKRCEGPMPYDVAQELHVHYTRMRPVQCEEFQRWSKARSEALRAHKDWPLALTIGEYPDGDR